MQYIPARLAALTPTTASSITTQFFAAMPNFSAPSRKHCGLGLPSLTSSPLINKLKYLFIPSVLVINSIFSFGVEETTANSYFALANDLINSITPGSALMLSFTRWRKVASFSSAITFTSANDIFIARKCGMISSFLRPFAHLKSPSVKSLPRFAKVSCQACL